MFKKLKYKKNSYSQCGEDLIVEFILNEMGLKNITYLDVGAHHPYYLSNTALFYEKGFSGICVEPDPEQFKEIKKYRKRDSCKNVGIGIDHQSDANFYIMSTPTLNTFSEEEALRYAQGSHKIIRVDKIPLITIEEIMVPLHGNIPNFISLDVEGMDYEILKSFDFSRFRPEVFCVETLTYTEDNSEKKLNKIIDFMISNNYFVYADTYINTIFVDSKKWKCRKGVYNG